MRSAVRTVAERPFEVVPKRIAKVSGREVRWYRIPPERELIQDPRRSYDVECKIDRFSDTLWIFSLSRRFNGGSTKNLPSLETAEQHWRTWLERRTQPRW